MVVMETMFSKVESEDHRVEVNCVPLSKVSWAGTSRAEMKEKAAVTFGAKMVEREVASSQREVRSTMVSR